MSVLDCYPPPEWQHPLLDENKHCQVLSGQTIEKSTKNKGTERRDLRFQVIHREDENCETARLIQSIFVPLCEKLDHMLVNDVTEWMTCAPIVSADRSEKNVFVKLLLHF